MSDMGICSQTFNKWIISERRLISDSQEAGHRVADDGHQPRGRKLLVVEVQQSLDDQVPGMVAGDEGVVHDLLAGDVADQSKLHLHRFLRKVMKLQLQTKLGLSPL